ncbi:MAG: carbonic anhydrase [Bacteroidales bacterium]
MKKLLFVVAAVAMLSCNSVKKESTVMVEESLIETPEQAIAALEDGNMRFMNNKSLEIHDEIEYVKSLASGQAPFACVICCSDSRVPAELLFNQGFGDLFVVRTAGNTVLDNFTLGSVEYAATHLGVKAIVVLGHTSCGAITAIIDKEAHGDHSDHGHGDMVETPLGEMLGVIEHLLPKGTELSVDDAIMANIAIQVETIMSEEGVAKMVADGDLVVVPAIYDIATGEVTFM